MRGSVSCLPVAMSLLLLLGAQGVGAYSRGVTGVSGIHGGTCEGCHGGGLAPLVSFEGPREVEAGTTAWFSFVVESLSPDQKFAGFNVAASAGALEDLPGEGARVASGELTHVAPKPSVEGIAHWDFLWHAPERPGDQDLYGAGLSANGNGNRNGDELSTTRWTVQVIRLPEPGDANCDQFLSAADFPALLRAWSAGAPGECSLADADCDGLVGQSDIDAVITGLFDAVARQMCGDELAD